MNRVRLQLTDVALSDIEEQAAWYEQRSGQSLARRWEYEVTAAFIRIERNPISGAKCSFRTDGLQGIRRMPIARFPKHLVFYHVVENEIRILRVVHGARDLETLF